MSTDTLERESVSAAVVSEHGPPSRLHHFSFYTKDVEACRYFYEDIIGIPLSAFWVEAFPETAETPAHVMGHAFFGLADGGILAFVHFHDEEMQAKAVGTEQPGSVHLALAVNEAQYAAILDRLRASEYGSGVMEGDGGIARSIYVRDPNGMFVEFTLDAPGAVYHSSDAHDVMKRYLNGDLTPTRAAPVTQ